MIVKQTTTLIFEYPQDYLQEQEWCKTKDDRWVHKSTDTLGAVYENQISCSVGASVSVKTEPQKIGYCNECKWFRDKQVCGRCRSKNLYASKDEPQTDCAWRREDGVETD